MSNRRQEDKKTRIQEHNVNQTMRERGARRRPRGNETWRGPSMYLIPSFSLHCCCCSSCLGSVLVRLTSTTQHRHRTKQHTTNTATDTAHNIRKHNKTPKATACANRRRGSECWASSFKRHIFELFKKHVHVFFLVGPTILHSDRFVFWSADRFAF